MVRSCGQVRWSGQFRLGVIRSSQVGSGCGQVRSDCGQVNFEIRRTKYHLVSFGEIWIEISYFQVAAISKQFELGGRGWANSLRLLKLFPDIN
jgi:hypothetical protein